MNQPKRILLVDDESAAREILVRGLKRHGFDARGVGDGVEAVALLHLPWDVIVLDIMMPRMDGIELLAEVQKRCLQTRRIVITSFADKDKVVAVLNRGADYLLEKPFGVERLVSVVQHVLEGDGSNTSDMEQFFLRRLRGLPLTDRERDLVTGLLRGQPNKQIAAELGLSEQTVKNMLSAAYAKLGIQSRAELFTLVFPI